mmetsp:Transcript_40924/g.64910  ORF Transcript_40924/g.64910 Transcript_40924/m.64910 type:complete len:208 (-) Transcript_40924:167-790(-)
MGLCCKIVACSCCGCCTLLIALVVSAIVIISNVKQPSVGITGIRFTKLQMESSSAQIDLTTNIWFDNPNGWPLSGSIQSLDATVYSVDGDQPDAHAIPLGEASLPQKVSISTHANTTFAIDFKGQPTGGEVIALLKQCVSQQTAEGSIRVRVNLKSAKIGFFGIKNIEVDLDKLNKPFFATVPCTTGQGHTQLVQSFVPRPVQSFVV